MHAQTGSPEGPPVALLEEPAAASPSDRPRRHRIRVLLVLPYLGLLFPAVYARNTPVLWGLPFFYWYQLLWVLLASAIIALVYQRTRDDRN